jgi:hypothetical protein
MVMEAIGIKSYNTYKNTLYDIVDWGFIIMIETSKNQWSANIIALSNFDKAHDKALDKALLKHSTKQSESTSESNSSIDKQITSKPIKQGTIPTYDEFKDYACNKACEVNIDLDYVKLKLKYDAWKENGWKNGHNKKIKNWKSTLLNTLNFLKEETKGSAGPQNNNNGKLTREQQRKQFFIDSKSIPSDNR